ncbi:MAG: hypothetical protein ACJ76N_15235 [Thermoanaerobaculia bacterium]
MNTLFIRRIPVLSLISLLWVAWSFAPPAAQKETEMLDRARQLFGRYVSLEETFDPAAADLYADAALIKNKRTYPTGEVREITFPAPKYKELIRQAMPLAKARGDRNRYSEVSYSVEGEHVRIHATRYSVLKEYSSPISLLVGPGTAGQWLIYEELTESKP